MVVEDQPKPREFVVERNGQRLPITITPTRRTEGTDPVGEVGILPDYGVTVPVTIKSVTAGAPASKAGIQPGDRLVAINGEQIRNRDQATGSIYGTQENQVQLTVERNGQQVEVASGLNPSKDETGKTQPRLGVEFSEIVPRENGGLASAASYAVRNNVQILKLTGKALKQLFSGERSARNTLSGPIGIYDAASASVNEAGWGGIFAMLGFLSLSLGVFNLLPIPVLDGGAIFLLLVEAVMALGGWKLSMRVRERIQQVGFVMLLLLMGFVITNDVLKKVSRSPEENKPPATAAPNK
jgi:regulator of sigma E protease